MSGTKSRNISKADLFYYLQLEWVSYYIRSKIYEREWDIDYFNKVLNLKKEKIEKLALKNAMPSIFSSQKRLDKYLFEYFYPETSNIPFFQYTPKNQKRLQYWDFKLFYKMDTQVVCNDGHVTKILRNNVSENTVVVSGKNRTLETKKYSEVRIDLSIFFD